MRIKNLAICDNVQLGRAVLSVAVLLTFTCAGVDASGTTHFAFDETGGGTATDSAGNLSGDLVAKGAQAALGDPTGALPTFVPGKFGNALYVDGVGGNNDTPGLNIRSGDFSVLDYGTTTDFSLAYWLKSDPNYEIISADSIYSGLYGEGGTFSGSAFQFTATRSGGFNGHYLRYGSPSSGDTKPSADYDGPALITDDEWHHYAWTVDRDGDTTMYLDGEAVATRPVDSTGIDFSGATGINVMGDQYGGSIDELLVTDQALSAEAVNSLFTSNVVPEPTTLALLVVGGLAVFLGIRRR